MKTIRSFLTFFVLALLVAWGCSSLDPMSPGPVNTGSASFARFNVVGDNYTAGMQNGGLVEGFQRATWGAVVAQAAQAAQHVFPNISENGIPQTMYVSDYSGPTIDQLPNQGQPTNTRYSGIYNNNGIPGATLGQLLRQDALYPPGQNPFFSIVLRDTLLGSAVEATAAAQPTMLAVWAGWTDAFGGASKGTALALTPAGSFETDYRTVMDTFVPTAGAIVAATLPEIDDIPYFATIPPFGNVGGNIVLLWAEVGGTPTELTQNAMVLLTAAPLLQLGYGLPPGTPGGPFPALPDSVVIDGTERTTITGRITQYNTVIDTVCANRDIPVVDMVGLFNDMSSSGFSMRGETYTSDYLENSLFSVDGLHPNSIGYYVIALEFIKVINANFGAAIPQPALPLGIYRSPSLGSGGPAAAAATIEPKEWSGLLGLMESGVVDRRR